MSSNLNGKLVAEALDGQLSKALMGSSGARASTACWKPFAKTLALLTMSAS